MFNIQKHIKLCNISICLSFCIITDFFIFFIFYLQEYPIAYDWENLKLRYSRKDAIEEIRKMSNYYFSKQRFYIKILNHVKYVHAINCLTGLDSKYCDHYRTIRPWSRIQSINNRVIFCQNKCFYAETTFTPLKLKYQAAFAYKCYIDPYVMRQGLINIASFNPDFDIKINSSIELIDYFKNLYIPIKQLCSCINCNNHHKILRQHSCNICKYIETYVYLNDTLPYVIRPSTRDHIRQIHHLTFMGKYIIDNRVRRKGPFDVHAT